MERVAGGIMEKRGKRKIHRVDVALINLQSVHGPMNAVTAGNKSISV